MTTSTNATETRTSELEENFSAALMDCAPVGVITVDATRHVIAINAKAEQILKLSAAEIIGLDFSRLPEPLVDLVDEALVTGHSSEPHPLGATHISRLSGLATIARASDGLLSSVLIEFQELTTAQAISANLEHLDRLAGLGVVTAGVAHEIKNALVAVRTFFDLAGLGETDVELRNVAAGEIQRIEKTVRQLLRGAKREQFRLAPLSVHALVQDAVNLLRHELQTREIQLTTSFHAPVDRVNGDERQLRHALVNVLLNAVEAIGSSGHLTITSEVVDAWERQHLRVSIKDSGPGISIETQGKLFNPFFTTKSDGTGLGLPISQRIFQAHNGTITVESQPGVGATFHMFLPLL